MDTNNGEIPTNISGPQTLKHFRIVPMNKYSHIRRMLLRGILLFY
jgi:hypothetical protein